MPESAAFKPNNKIAQKHLSSVWSYFLLKLYNIILLNFMHNMHPTPKSLTKFDAIGTGGGVPFFRDFSNNNLSPFIRVIFHLFKARENLLLENIDRFY